MSLSVDLTLCRIRLLLAELPPYTRKTIHVAGTNGKGSVTAYLSHIYAAGSYRVGRFNSPHLVDVWDSITINNEPITEDLFHRVRSQVLHVDSTKAIGCSSFELLTATALQVFEEKQVDVAIVEVGMGGGRDATNAIPDESILASAITNIALDHQAYLGDTIHAIASEKAGIARPGLPLILARQTFPEARLAIETVSKIRKAAIQDAIAIFPSHLPEFKSEFRAHLPRLGYNFQAAMPLRGSFQRDNLAVALTVVDHLHDLYLPVSESDLLKGIRTTKWPGRMQLTSIQLLPSSRPISVLVDGAHNAAAAAALSEYIDTLPRRPRQFILALSHSPTKPASSVLTPLLRCGDTVHVIPFSQVDGMPWAHPMNASSVLSTVRLLVGDEGEARSGSSLTSALEYCISAAQHRELDKSCPEVVIAGSLYLIADFFRLKRSLGVQLW